MQLLKMKTVDSIVAAFTKTVSDLEAVEQSSRNDAAERREQAAELVADAQRAEVEAERARNIAANLKTLLGSAG